MSTGRGRKVTPEDIERVQDLIERCILNYMKRKEVVDVLYQHHNIHPCFTRIVWRNLEEQNKKFFRNYYMRMAAKDQITRFNNFFKTQAAMMKQLNPNEAAAIPPMQPIPFNLPACGFNDRGSLWLQRSSDHQFNTPLAQNQNVGMNNGIPYNTYSGDLGNSAPVSSSSNMDSNSVPQLQRTFTDELSAFLSPHPGSSLFDSNGIRIENQGENIRVPNLSSNFEFQNSRFVEMSQRSNNFLYAAGPTTSCKMHVQDGIAYIGN